MRTGLALIALLGMVAVCLAGSISTEAEVCAPADRVAVMMFVRQEVSENQSGEAALDATWDRARQWLINNGFTPDRIVVGEAAVRLFSDEKQYLVRRITLVEPIDPQKADQSAEKLARLVDQAMARGLEPASRLTVLEADRQGMMYRSGEIAGQFVFFLPRDPAKLVEEATRKGMEQLRRQIELLSATASLPTLHQAHLSIEEPPLLDTDLADGRIGISGASADAVSAQVKVSGLGMALASESGLRWV